MPDLVSYNSEIAKHYGRSQWIYKYFWYSQKSLGMHCGFWEKNTKTNDDALINQYRYVINKAKVKRGMRILDAGCGVGGGAIYIAKHTGAKVDGITITPQQVTEAIYNAQSAQVVSLTAFTLQDYTDTSFKDGTFDVIFAIESVCHAFKKSSFLNEAYRILKPSGILIINDGYLKKSPISTKEKTLYRSFCAGWKLHELVNYEEMEKEMYHAHFRNVSIDDKSAAVRPTLRSIGRLLTLLKPLLIVAKYLKLNIFQAISENAQSLSTLNEGDQIGLFGYYSFMAKK